MKITAAFVTFAILCSDSSHGFEREAHRIRGHMAALFTPFHPDGSLDLGEVPFWPFLELNLVKSIEITQIWQFFEQVNYRRWLSASKSGESTTSW